MEFNWSRVIVGSAYHVQGAAATPVDNATRSLKRVTDFIVEILFFLVGKCNKWWGSILCAISGSGSIDERRQVRVCTMPNMDCLVACSVRSKDKTLVPQQSAFMKMFLLNNVRGSACGHFRNSHVKCPREKL